MCVDVCVCVYATERKSVLRVLTFLSLALSENEFTFFSSLDSSAQSLLDKTKTHKEVARDRQMPWQTYATEAFISLRTLCVCVCVSAYTMRVCVSAYTMRVCVCFGVHYACVCVSAYTVRVCVFPRILCVCVCVFLRTLCVCVFPRTLSIYTCVYIVAVYR